jgi:hypothetical protein
LQVGGAVDWRKVLLANRRGFAGKHRDLDPLAAFPHRVTSADPHCHHYSPSNFLKHLDYNNHHHTATAGDDPGTDHYIAARDPAARDPAADDDSAAGEHGSVDLDVAGSAVY